MRLTNNDYDLYLLCVCSTSSLKHQLLMTVLPWIIVLLPCLTLKEMMILAVWELYMRVLITWYFSLTMLSDKLEKI